MITVLLKQFQDHNHSTSTDFLNTFGGGLRNLLGHPHSGAPLDAVEHVGPQVREPRQVLVQHYLGVRQLFSNQWNGHPRQLPVLGMPVVGGRQNHGPGRLGKRG